MSTCPACKNTYPPSERFCALDGTELLPDQSNTVDTNLGALIGNYRLLEKLGEGGMGTVYRAEHPGLGRQAAVKLLRPEYAKDTEIILRFFDEARAVNKIRHKHILDVFDLGRTPDGVAYLIAELLVGEDLERRLRREKALPIPRICSILAQVCEALQAAHGAGIIHRDLKPENVFLCEQDGQKDFVKIVDFGIAKLIEGENQNKTKTGLVMGTPHYMSPEQATGKKQIDGRADLYSLGIILYECLTGQTPFRGDTMAGIVMQHILEKATPPRKAAPERDIPAELDALTMKLLEKDPTQRYQSAAEVRDILLRHTGHAPTPAPNLPSAPTPTQLPQKSPQSFTQTLSQKIVPLVEAARVRAKQLDPKTRLLGAGIAIGLGVAAIFYMLFSGTPSENPAQMADSPLFAPRSTLPKECDALFKMACDCEAVRVSNCDPIQNSIKDIEKKLKQKNTPQSEIDANLRESCKETARKLEPVRKKFCE